MSGGDGEIVWRPSAERIARARVTAFRAAANRRHGLELADHDALWDWSVAEPASFWRLVWDEAGVVGEGPGNEILVHGDRMPGAAWFPAARLNYAENLLHGAGAADGDPALVCRDESGPAVRVTFGELRREVRALAAALAADGVGAGDRVAGLLPNRREAVVAALATSLLGAVWSSCSPDFGPQGVLDRFGQIEPAVLLTADGYRYGGRAIDCRPAAAELRRRLPGVRRWIEIEVLGEGPLPAGAERWSETLARGAGSAVDPARMPFDHPLFIMYSSGTTGLPKCMVHSAGGTLLQHLKEHRLHCDLGSGDRLFYFTTCGWMMWNWLVSGLASGAAVLLYDGHPLRPAPVLWDLAAEERCTVFGTSARWLAAAEKEGLRPAETHDLDGLRAVLSTGSPLAPASFDYVYRDVKSDVQLSSISGGTDIISCFALGSPVLPVRRGELQCRGLGMDVAVFDDGGSPLTGAKGELVCRRPFPSMPVGFWNDPDGSRYRAAYFDRFDGVWCHGDFAELTETGGMVIHGRSDTVLNPGGVRIGTAEIYRVVERFEAIIESLVVGLERRGDTRVVLFVVMAEGRELDADLKRSLRDRLRSDASPRHVPARIVAVPAIPRTISGKIVELAVREVLHGREPGNRDAMANPEALDHFAGLAGSLD